MGGVDRIVAIGTSALRSAINADEFAAAVKQRHGFDIRVISGDEEAQMVFDGVKQVLPLGMSRVLILDIGGGSCEFIIANKDGIAWRHSYEVGMSRVLDKFKPSNPITAKQIRDIEAYFRGGTQGLYDALREFPTSSLTAPLTPSLHNRNTSPGRTSAIISTVACDMRRWRSGTNIQRVMMLRCGCCRASSAVMSPRATISATSEWSDVLQ